MKNREVAFLTLSTVAACSSLAACFRDAVVPVPSPPPAVEIARITCAETTQNTVIEALISELKKSSNDLVESNVVVKHGLADVLSAHPQRKGNKLVNLGRKSSEITTEPPSALEFSLKTSLKISNEASLSAAVRMGAEVLIGNTIHFSLIDYTKESYGTTAFSNLLNAERTRIDGLSTLRSEDEVDVVVGLYSAKSATLTVGDLKIASGEIKPVAVGQLKFEIQNSCNASGSVSGSGLVKILAPFHWVVDRYEPGRGNKAP